MEWVRRVLEEHKDETYARFQRKLIPNIDAETIVGVRTPMLRGMAKELKNDVRGSAFLKELPHTCFEENQLHGFLISEISDFRNCIKEVEKFLPYMDNWATCDQTSPKIFKKYREELLPYIRKWLNSKHTYTVRFAIGMLMQHFLEEDFQPEYLELVAGVNSEEYYIRMEIAWYMATALAKQWKTAITYLEDCRMAPWVHNKTIQKARESLRITLEQKEFLKGLKV